MRRRETTLIKLFGLILLVAGLAACGPAQDPEFEAATATAAAEGIGAEEAEEAQESEFSESAADESAREDESASESEEVSSAEQSSAPEVSPDGDFDVYAGLGEDSFETTDSGLQYVILEEADGELPEVGQVVSVHYTGWLEDGTSFDSSVERGEPFSFPLGQQMVIAGWDEGIELLHVGEKARLVIPGDLAYGPGGRPGIPPDATLIFDVELVSIAEGAPEAPTEVDADDYIVTDSGLQYYDLAEGNGPMPEEGLVATMHFTVWLEDGTFLGSTLDSGQPIQAMIGSGQLFPGWEEGLLSMPTGTSRQLVVPPELAFGETGTPDGTIPPNTTLILEIELLDVLDPAQ